MVGILMQEGADSAHASYINAKPFPHVVFDNFFDPALLDFVPGRLRRPAVARVRAALLVSVPSLLCVIPFSP